MVPLSHSLSLLPVSGRADVRCHLGAPWSSTKAREACARFRIACRRRGALCSKAATARRAVVGTLHHRVSDSGPHRTHGGSDAKPIPATERRNITLTVAENARRVGYVLFAVLGRRPHQTTVIRKDFAIGCQGVLQSRFRTPYFAMYASRSASSETASPKR
jgi:hypothetical protein